MGHTTKRRQSPQHNKQRMVKYHTADHRQVRPFIQNKPADSKQGLEHARILNRISATAAHEDTDSVTCAPRNAQ